MLYGHGVQFLPRVEYKILFTGVPLKPHTVQSAML